MTRHDPAASRTRKPRAPRSAKPAPAAEAAEPARSATGALLASDGRPVFADGLSRHQWLAVHAEERKAALVEQLKQEPEADDV